MCASVRISPNVLAEIVSRFGARPDPTSEALRFPLRNCGAVAVVEQEGDGGQEFPIEIVDISVNGIGFKTSLCLPDDATLIVRLRFPGIRPQSWRCRVVDVHAQGANRCWLRALFLGTLGSDSLPGVKDIPS
jgi:hypothetical protein